MPNRMLTQLRRYLVTGLVVVAPVGVTIIVLVWLFRRLDAILGQAVATVIGHRLPGLGLLVLVLLLLAVGWGLRWALGRKFVAWGNSLLSRLPLTRTIYNATSQITQTVLDRGERFFQSAALVEYPYPGSYTLAFVTARSPEELEEKVGKEAVNVFLPTSPNPTSGYVLVLPAERVRVLEMSVEDAMKMVLSFGALSPGRGKGPALAGLDMDHLTGVPFSAGEIGELPEPLRGGGPEEPGRPGRAEDEERSGKEDEG